MNFVNPPENAPEGVAHDVFFSRLIGNEIGYNIYLPPDYGQGGRHPVTYHLHGYMGSESSDIRALENVCKNRRGITVFVNTTSGDLPIEQIIITELIPHIDAKYNTIASRAGRSLSGWSMGGAGAFRLAVKYPDMFSAVTAYAGTYHHWFHKDYLTVGKPADKAAGLFESMMKDERCFDEAGMFYLIRKNAADMRENLNIRMKVGTEDPLICDNEIMHMYLVSLDIPHEYVKIGGAAHKLDRIV